MRTRRKRSTTRGRAWSPRGIAARSAARDTRLHSTCCPPATVLGTMDKSPIACSIVQPTEDLEALASVQLAAFAPGEIHQLIFGNVTRADFLATASLRLQVDTGKDRGPKRVVKAERDGQLLGFSIWEVPAAGGVGPEKGLSKEAEEERKRQRWPKGTKVALAEEFFSQANDNVTIPHFRECQKSSCGAQLTLEATSRSQHPRRGSYTPGFRSRKSSP